MWVNSTLCEVALAQPHDKEGKCHSNGLWFAGEPAQLEKCYITSKEQISPVSLHLHNT